jgi:uncharacterized protein (TIGR02452 family)
MQGLIRRNKKVCKRKAEETLRIINAGYYECGGHHNIPPPITTIYLQADVLKRIKQPIKNDYIPLDNRFVRKYIETRGEVYNTDIELWNISSLGAAQKLRSRYPNDKICVLNFASARNPGGGFLNGAQAQEESLVRSSSLYTSLSQAESFYDVNNAAGVKDPSVSSGKPSSVYTHNIIYTENVIVFRDDSEDENLLEHPYIVDFITCPAVNRRINQLMSNFDVDNVMIQRTVRLFAVAKKHGVQHLVLGAWGCGVFKNDPWFIINMFLQQLSNDFQGTFKSVVFAVLGDSIYNCFREAIR